MRMFSARALFFTVWVGGLLTACGYGQLQTAKTTPKGDYRITMGQFYLYNENQDERGVAPTNFPQQLALRVGVHERVDMGLNLFFLLGALLDAKVNVIEPESRFALALSAGLGAAVDYLPLVVREEDPPWLVHVPVGVLASYRFWDCFSPYAGVTYGFYWIFRREKPSIDLEPGYELVDRKGYGDGLIRFSVGLEWMLNIRFGFLLEYAFFLPVVNDPGDYYTFVKNHIFGFGIRF